MKRPHGFGLAAAGVAVAATTLLVDGRVDRVEDDDPDGDDDSTVEIEIILTDT